MQMDKNTAPFSNLYPHFTQSELAETEDILERYVVLVLRVFERMESEANPQAS